MTLIPQLGIDLGTANILVYKSGAGVVMCEPTVVATDSASGTVLAVGNEARNMLGRTPGNITAVRPLRDGTGSVTVRAAGRMWRPIRTRSISIRSYNPQYFRIDLPDIEVLLGDPARLSAHASR